MRSPSPGFEINTKSSRKNSNNIDFLIKKSNPLSPKIAMHDDFAEQVQKIKEHSNVPPSYIMNYSRQGTPLDYQNSRQDTYNYSEFRAPTSNSKHQQKMMPLITNMSQLNSKRASEVGTQSMIKGSRFSNTERNLQLGTVEIDSVLKQKKPKLKPSPRVATSQQISPRDKLSQSRFKIDKNSSITRKMITLSSNPFDLMNSLQATGNSEQSMSKISQVGNQEGYHRISTKKAGKIYSLNQKLNDEIENQVLVNVVSDQSIQGLKKQMKNQYLDSSVVRGLEPEICFDMSQPLNDKAGQFYELKYFNQYQQLKYKVNSANPIEEASEEDTLDKRGYNESNEIAQIIRRDDAIAKLTHQQDEEDYLERAGKSYVKRTGIPQQRDFSKEALKDLQFKRNMKSKTDALRKYLEYEKAVSDPKNLKFMEFRRLQMQKVQQQSEKNSSLDELGLGKIIESSDIQQSSRIPGTRLHSNQGRTGEERAGNLAMLQFKRLNVKEEEDNMRQAIAKERERLRSQISELRTDTTHRLNSMNIQPSPRALGSSQRRKFQILGPQQIKAQSAMGQFNKSLPKQGLTNRFKIKSPLNFSLNNSGIRTPMQPHTRGMDLNMSGGLGRVTDFAINNAFSPQANVILKSNIQKVYEDGELAQDSNLLKNQKNKSFNQQNFNSTGAVLKLPQHLNQSK